MRNREECSNLTSLWRRQLDIGEEGGDGAAKRGMVEERAREKRGLRKLYDHIHPAYMRLKKN